MCPMAICILSFEKKSVVKWKNIKSMDQNQYPLHNDMSEKELTMLIPFTIATKI